MNASTAVPFGLLVEPEQVVPFIDDPDIRIIDLSRESIFEQIHLPHAILVKPKELLKEEEFAAGKLPNTEQLQALIDRLGLTEQHHVVVYDDEGGGWAGRFIWNLHCAGFYQTSLLNGGIHAWLAAGLATSTEITEITPVLATFQVNCQQQQQFRIEYEELSTLVEQQAVQLWDCRTEQEYTGIRLAARRGGHIAGAKWYEWSTAINRQDHLKLHPLTRTQQQLEQRGFDLSRPVVVYCQSHHRSGLAYIIGRLLNWEIRAYDGAWSEWGNRSDSAIINGEQPF
ncbi:sulfurtransferase [Acinetobacter qingfengensis]|nr:rhodanese-like domain-containing protein [Acinetobacter qingfengensis]KAA8733931.1 sulfurtransferase [Acinetobacter qingfengensis]